MRGGTRRAELTRDGHDLPRVKDAQPKRSRETISATDDVPSLLGPANGSGGSARQPLHRCPNDMPDGDDFGMPVRRVSRRPSLPARIRVSADHQIHEASCLIEQSLAPRRCSPHSGDVDASHL